MSSPSHADADADADADAEADAAPDYDEQCRKATADLSSLNRVSHRLALVDTTERLQQVLDKLLPRLLLRIGDNHQALKLLAAQNSAATPSMAQLASTLDKIHASLIETLSHTMKRVRDDASCQIPALAILQLLLLQQQPVNGVGGGDGESSDSTTTMTIPQSNLDAVDPFTLNLSLAFLTVGLPRMKHADDNYDYSTTAASIAAMLPGLLVLHGATAGLVSLAAPSRRLQAHQIAHLLLQCLSAVATQPPQKQSQKQRSGAGTAGAVNTASAKTGSATAAASTTVSSTTTPSLTAADHIALARTVLAESPLAAAACFDLILDVLLYPNNYNSNSSLPPDGLSQAANERFQPSSSSSSSSRGDNWAVVLAVGTNVAQVKVALLDVIAPHRQWALFAPNNKDAAAVGAGNNSAAAGAMGLARTVALTVAATGDVAVEVSERATTHVKIHLDSVRGSANESAMGDPVQLVCGLLSLCLGQTHAESILQAATAAVATTGADVSPFQTLGRTEQPTGSESSQLVFSTKRRPVSESTAAAILSFCSSKILDDHPTLLDDASPVAVACLGQLVVKVAAKTLRGLTGASGLSALRAKPYIAAAQLLNSLCIRLTVYYDTTTMTTHQSSIDNGDEESSSPRAVVELLAQSLSTACEVLSGASTQRPAASKTTTTSNAGNIAVRDACYGVVCTLSRSRFALARAGYVFTRGKGQLSSSSNASTKLVVSIETASLLFGCAANEEETLRPRAVAALDALLGACCRVYEIEPNKPILKEQATPADASANPWANAVTTATATPLASDDTDGVNVDRAGLSRALLPLIWTAGQTYQPKASRVAAARWSSDLLKNLDLPSACHIMCFLAGDSDITASSIAREGLGLPKHVTEEIPTNTDDSVQLPGFGNFAEMVFFSGTGAGASSIRLRRFWDFSPQGRAAALRFGLLCMLNDIYGGEDHAVGVYLSALTETLNVFLREGTGISTAQGRSSIDLLDEASTCLFAAVSTSQFARKQLWSEKKDGFAIREIESLCLRAASSRARRHLAGACGRMYEDTGVWEGGPEEVPSLERWLSLSRLDVVVDATAEKLSEIGSNHLVSSQIHGAAFLGAYAARAFRLQAVRLPVEDAATDNLWDKLASILAALGRGLLHPDEIIGNACADGLGIAFSYDGMDAPLLDSRLHNGSATVLNQLAAALVKYGNGDSTDASRAAKLAKAAGDSLSASTSGSGVVAVNATGEDAGLGPARVKCADALFALLGSMAFRKDEEIGLIAGEALASYADAYSPKNVVWGAANLEWPEDFSESFASQLPPHQHVIYVLLRKIVAASSPHMRTAAAPALLALVARATKGVSSTPSIDVMTISFSNMLFANSDRSILTVHT
jgi:proteasome component ECM29